MSKNQTTLYGTGQAKIFPAPTPIPFNRQPTGTDTRYEIGQQLIFGDSVYELTRVVAGVAHWTLLGSGSAGGVASLTGNSGGAITPVLGNIDILGGDTTNVVGTSGTLTIDTAVGGYPITPFVVGASGEAGYQTIQSALDAANAVGGGLVFVQPGTYTENLTFYDGIELFGSSEQGTFIVGVHTPPASGTLNIFRCTFQSATDVFNSNAAGSTVIIIEDCTIDVTNGFTFNLPNWTGGLALYDMGDESTNNGVVNNTGGATCFFVSVTIGAGTGQTMVTSGPVILQEVDHGCPWNAQTGSVINSTYVSYSNTVTLSNNSTGTFQHDIFSTGATAAIVMSSSAAISVLNSVVTSSNNPAINGAGAGTLTLGNVTFTSNAATAGTLTLAYATSRLGPSNVNGNITLNLAGNKLLSTSVAATTTAGANSFGTVALVGGTATVATTAVTANSMIFATVQALGTVTDPQAIAITAKTAATSFVITSADATDTSTVAWFIVN